MKQYIIPTLLILFSLLLTMTTIAADTASPVKDDSWKKSWYVNAVWYQVFPDRFFIHRYNASDYRVIEPLLGNRDDLVHLISTLHESGIHLILDGVFNHTGYEFWAFQDVVRNGKKSPCRDWYYIKRYPVTKLWQVSKSNPASYECWWGVPSLPKLNYANKEVREHIYEITRLWMSCGIDGWRLDVPDEIKYDDFWKEWRQVVKGAKSDAYITGEIWNDAAKWVNDGTMFDAVMNYHGFRDPVLKYFAARKITVSAFDRMLADRRALYPHGVNCAMQNLLGSHDTARILSVLHNGDEKDSDKDRKGYYKGPVSEETIKRYRTLALFQMTYVGAPMIYYGDEIGMEGGKDPDCRRPMIWSEKGQNSEILGWYRKLIDIRKSHQALRTGEFSTLVTDDEKNVYAFERREGRERIVVIFNYSAHRTEKELTVKGASALKDLFTGSTLARKETGTFLASLEPYGGYILQVEEN